MEEALKLFINHLRIFIGTELFKSHGDNWSIEYYKNLSEHQQDFWNRNSKIIENEFELIDYTNLPNFAFKSNFFEKHSPHTFKRYMSRFQEINDVRNAIAHYTTISSDKKDQALQTMLTIAIELGIEDLEKKLRKFKDDKFRVVSSLEKSYKAPTPPVINKPDRRELVQQINEKFDASIKKSQLNFSTINKSGDYSIEPNFKRAEDQWCLVLINNKVKTCFVFKIPKKHPVYEKLSQRNDKPVFRLIFDPDDKNYREKQSSVRFDQFLVGTLEY